MGSWNQSKNWFKSDLQRLQLCNFFGVNAIKIWCPLKELSRLAFCSLMPDEFMKNEPLLIHFSSMHNARCIPASSSPLLDSDRPSLSQSRALQPHSRYTTTTSPATALHYCPGSRKKTSS